MVLFGFGPVTRTTCQGTQEESHLLGLQIIGLLTVVPAVDGEAAHDGVPVPLRPGHGAVFHVQGLARRHASQCSWRQTCWPPSICRSRSGPVTWLQVEDMSVYAPGGRPAYILVLAMHPRVDPGQAPAPFSWGAEPVLLVRNLFRKLVGVTPIQAPGNRLSVDRLRALKWTLVPAPALLPQVLEAVPFSWGPAGPTVTGPQTVDPAAALWFLSLSTTPFFFPFSQLSSLKQECHG